MSRMVVAAWVLALGACAAAPPDTVLLNGKIFTSDAGRPWVQALAIRGGRIVAVGDSAGIAAQAGTATRRIDLGGRTVVPGFNDAHAHIGPHLPLVRLTSGDNPTTPDLERALQAAVAQASDGRLIQGSIGERVWADGTVTRAWLDARAPSNPVRLSAWTGHGVILNSTALTLAGVDEATGDPDGGRFLRDAAGRLNGRAEEYADYLVARRIALKVDRASGVEAYRAFARDAAALGITSIQLMGDALPVADIVSRLVEARTPLRWHVYRFPIREAGGETIDSRPPLPPQPGPLVDARGMKFILDGTPIERLALLRAPYADAPGEAGRSNFTPERLREFGKWAYGSEDRILAHAVGDGAIDRYLTALEQTGLPEIWREKRPRLEHGDLLFPDLVARAKALGVVVVQNPAHLTLHDELLARLGPERASQLQPLKSLLAAGIPLALGSDGPLSPGLNVMFASTHPVRPAEALSREEAVTAYTAGSAFAEFADRDKGRLSVGMLADLAVLSADLFTVPADRLPDIRSVLTLVGGRIAHDAGVVH